MKVCTVSAAAIAKHKRLDAGYYLGLVDGADIDEAITRAEAQVAGAIKRLVTLCRQKQEHSQRIAKMIHDGEIKPW